MAGDYDRLGRAALRRGISLRPFGFIPGNHDNLDELPGHALCTVDRGFAADGPLFLARGARSPVRAADWSPMEQMTYLECCRCVSAFSGARPRVVMSHDGPRSVTSAYEWAHGPRSRTASTMDAMLQQHRPRGLALRPPPHLQNHVQGRHLVQMREHPRGRGRANNR